MEFFRLFLSCFIPGEPHNPFGWFDVTLSCGQFVYFFFFFNLFLLLEHIQTPEGAHLLYPFGVKGKFKKFQKR